MRRFIPPDPNASGSVGSGSAIRVEGLHKVGALVESPALYPKLSGYKNLLARPGPAGEGTSVVVSSDLLSEIRAACDRLVMIQDGHVLFPERSISSWPRSTAPS